MYISSLLGLAFFFIIFILLLSGGILILLIFRDQVIHVWFGFCEFHLVHTFTGVPMEECLTSEHSSELFSNSLEHFLDSGGVSDEGDGHLKALWWNITNAWLNVVWNPFNEVRWVLVLDVQHLFIDFLSGHSSSEESGSGQISAVSWVGSTHHVLGIEHLLSKFWDGQSSVLLGSSWGKGGKSNHEEVKSGEWNQVDSELSQVRVQLTWESEAACNTRHGSRDEVVKVTICGGGKLEGSEADIVEGFVINNHALIGILDQLVDWKGSVVWFNDGVWDLWRWDDWEGFHNSVWVFFSDLWDQKGSHTRSGTTT